MDARAGVHWHSCLRETVWCSRVGFSVLVLARESKEVERMHSPPMCGEGPHTMDQCSLTDECGGVCVQVVWDNKEEGIPMYDENRNEVWEEKINAGNDAFFQASLTPP